MDWLVMFLTVISMETNGDPINMIGDNGRALGIIQIHMVVVEEYNSEHGTFFSHSQVRDPNLSIAIARWYLDKWGKNYQRIHGKEPTPDILYRIWNGGPRGWEKRATEKKGEEALQKYNTFQLLDRKKQLELYNKWVREFKNARIPKTKTQPMKIRTISVAGL